MEKLALEKLALEKLALDSASVEPVTIETRDGRSLVGRLHRPAGEPRAAIVLHGATGVPAGYYQEFAAWLASTCGAATLTYDYRDFGWSLQRSMKDSDASFSDWAIKDQSAALSHLGRLFPHLPLRVIGHSLGGQWLAFHDEVQRIDRVVAVASGPAYWRDHPWSYQAQVLAFWWLVGPLAAAIAGYMPGRMIGLGADLPANVYWEWRRLCLTRGFHQPGWGGIYPTPRLADARFDLTIAAVADDVVIPPPVTRRLAAFYPHARTREVVIDPRSAGLKRIGHLAAFAPRSRGVWPTIAAPLVD